MGQPHRVDVDLYDKADKDLAVDVLIDGNPGSPQPLSGMTLELRIEDLFGLAIVTLTGTLPGTPSNRVVFAFNTTHFGTAAGKLQRKQYRYAVVVTSAARPYVAVEGRITVLRTAGLSV